MSLGKLIIVNDFLFEDVFETEFSGVMSYMYGVFPKDFEASLEVAKAIVVEPSSDLLDFGPLSLCFENRILDHMIATMLISRKGSLSNISSRDVFVLYCLLKKY